jgi:hypothetical protein
LQTAQSQGERLCAVRKYTRRLRGRFLPSVFICKLSDRAEHVRQIKSLLVAGLLPVAQIWSERNFLVCRWRREDSKF